VDLCGLGSIQYFEIDSTSELRGAVWPHVHIRRDELPQDYAHTPRNWPSKSERTPNARTSPWRQLLLCNELLAYRQIRNAQESPPTISPGQGLLPNCSYNHTLGYYCVS
jgi:hypothetical protein